MWQLDNIDLWSTTKLKSSANISSTLLKIDECEIYTEGNTCGVIVKPVIKTTFYNEYNHILNDIPTTTKYIDTWYQS